MVNVGALSGLIGLLLIFVISLVLSIILAIYSERPVIVKVAAFCGHLLFVVISDWQICFHYHKD